ncbi:arylamine N-acetyltransferase [Pseudomonas sp. RW10S2]|uniref:arylamine N-acetyltransferase family protein n=1 Tax=Pseudomonas sp. RW10S2 TaxID=459637 RepID=UPI0016444165|nr:arylamine N-acetyltransferase [Pseudomonas sp. RW10S2]MBC3467656.1 arylamine N-acetyltransferase [Pseudomonas sp. RW10S2]QXI45272.1 arylamine N-acetyltransferase [Pseudomonas wayambapalatensis]
MNRISAAFFRRIGWTKTMDWHHDGINRMIASSLISLPFDNLSVFDAPDIQLSQAYIIEKILTKGQGGLCYELNPLLHLVMEECGLVASLITATIYDNAEKQWFAFSDTHVLNIVEWNARVWVVDIGLGLNSPRLSVPLDGEVVEYGGSEYRIVQEASYYHLNYKRREATEWSIGYRFAIDYRRASIGELERSRHIITFEEVSPFNKNPMSAIFTATGHEVMTLSGHTITRNGKKIKIPLTETQFRALVNERACPVDV